MSKKNTASKKNGNRPPNQVRMMPTDNYIALTLNEKGQPVVLIGESLKGVTCEMPHSEVGHAWTHSPNVKYTARFLGGGEDFCGLFVDGALKIVMKTEVLRG